MFRQTISQQQINVKRQEKSQQERKRFPQIQLHPSITNISQLSCNQQSMKSHYLTLIVYNYLQTPKMQQFLGINIQTQGELCLARRKILKNPNTSTINQLQQTVLNNKKSFEQQQQQSPTLQFHSNQQHQQHQHYHRHHLNSYTLNKNNQNRINDNNQHECQYQYYLLYMVNDNVPLEQEEEIIGYEQNNRRLSNSSGKNSNNNNNNGSSILKVSLKTIITLLISLCDKVIVYELDKQKQSFIEKVFVESVNTCQKIKWQTKMHINRPNRLVFVRECYGERKQTHNKKLQNQKKKNYDSNKNDKNKQKSTQKQNERNERQFKPKSSTLTAATSLQTLQYYSSLQEYSQYLQIHRKKYLDLCSIYPQRPDHPYVEEIIKKNHCIKLISLKQILEIYNQAVKFMTGNEEKNTKGDRIDVGEMFSKINNPYSQMIQKVDSLDEPQKVRYYLQKVYELESITNLYNAIQYEIFHPHVTSKRSHEFIHKQIKKYLTAHSNTNNLIFTQHSLNHLQYIPPFSRQVTLSTQSKQKLLWKLNRLEKYQHQLQQQYKISPQMSQDKIFYQLRDQEIFNWIAKYKNRWLEISMAHLKGYFNKIANEKDHKAIQQFKQQCYKMTQKLNKIDIKPYDQPRQAMIKQIIKEINTFVDYHFQVLETRRLAGIKFLYHEIQYTLKHKQKVRNKLMLFALMIILALMQKNVIAGITIATMAIIVLAIRI